MFLVCKVYLTVVDEILNFTAPIITFSKLGEIFELAHLHIVFHLLHKFNHVEQVSDRLVFEGLMFNHNLSLKKIFGVKKGPNLL